jgi:hypothetical protein
VSNTLWANAPWEHPDWYDIHDTTWTAGPEREPEHYRELVIALPPLDVDDHLLDAGCGTGKLAALVARGCARRWPTSRVPSVRAAGSTSSRRWRRPGRAAASRIQCAVSRCRRSGPRSSRPDSQPLSVSIVSAIA